MSLKLIPLYSHPDISLEYLWTKENKPAIMDEVLYQVEMDVLFR